jgi:hypothetical protein
MMIGLARGSGAATIRLIGLHQKGNTRMPLMSERIEEYRTLEDRLRSFDPLANDFTEHLGASLTQLNLRQADIALAFNVSQSTVHRWCVGASRPDVSLQRSVVTWLRRRVTQNRLREQRRAKLAKVREQLDREKAAVPAQ